MREPFIHQLEGIGLTSLAIGNEDCNADTRPRVHFRDENAASGRTLRFSLTRVSSLAARRTIAMPFLSVAPRARPPRRGPCRRRPRLADSGKAVFRELLVAFKPGSERAQLATHFARNSSFALPCSPCSLALAKHSLDLAFLAISSAEIGAFAFGATGAAGVAGAAG